MHSLLTKYASAWDKLEKRLNDMGGNVVYTDEEDGVHGPTFYIGEDYVLNDGDKTYNLKGGDIAYGFKEKRPGVLAHEMGHADVWSKASDPYKWAVNNSLAYVVHRPTVKKLSTILPAAGLVGSLITKNPYWLLGGSGLGLVAAAPHLINEARANMTGKELLREVGGTEEDKKDVSGGFMGHLTSNAGIPAAGVLAAALLTYLNRDKKNG